MNARKREQVKVCEIDDDSWARSEMSGWELIAWVKRLEKTYSKTTQHKRGQLGIAETIPGTLMFHIGELTVYIECLETDFQYETRLRGEIINKEDIGRRERAELKRLLEKYGTEVK